MDVGVGTGVATALGVFPSHSGVTHGGLCPILSRSNKRGALFGGSVGFWGGGQRAELWGGVGGGGARHPQPPPRMRRTHPQPRTAAGTPPDPLCPIATP